MLIYRGKQRKVKNKEKGALKDESCISGLRNGKVREAVT